MVIKLIIIALLYLGLHIGLWKLFEKAKYKGWYSFVPVYDLIIWLRLIKKPWWWMLILLIPGINIVMFWVMLYNLAEAYGKETAGERAFAIFLFPIALPMWGFDDKVRYLGPDTNRTRSTSEQWLDAIVFAVIAATIIRTFFIEAFTIPTSSMEKSLMVGDFLFVSKVSYGARSPMTPLTIPFTHSTMPGTSDVPSFVDWVTLPYFRLPGLGHVERGDVVVFNFPEGDTVATKQPNNTYYAYVRHMGRDAVKNDKQQFGKIVYKPIDKRDHYVKRCVGVPGDMLQIKNDTLIVNGKAEAFPKRSQLHYYVKNLSNAKARSLGSTSEDIRSWFQGGGLPIPFEDIEKYQKAAGADSMFEKVSIPNGDIDVLPHDTALAKWSIQNFGPIHIPKEGETVELTPLNLAIYERCITAYEGNKLEKKDGKILINGQAATSYTFKQDYYWMMGDNRHGSLDSRYWGFVPNDHIVGTPVMVWMSFDPDRKFPTNIRTDRLISFVKNEGITRSYLLHMLGLLALILGIRELYNRGKLGFLKRK